MPPARRAQLAAPAALALALSGCSVIQVFTTHVESAIYESAQEFRANSSRLGSPAFVPDDATIIRVDYDTRIGEAIMTYTSPTHLAQGACTTEAPTPRPTTQDSWWPITSLPEKALDCGGGWSAFTIGDQVYAARGTTG